MVIYTRIHLYLIIKMTNGSYNFSRVDNATLYLNTLCYCTGKPNEFVNIIFYAINYNIL